MRTIDPVETIRADETTLRSIVTDLHDMIAGFRCAGTGRLVKAGVSMTHMHVMWLLEHHGDLQMTRLAEMLDVSMSSATGIVDRMEERGLIERARVPDDRRVVEVRLTPRGVQALEAIEAIKQDRLRDILGHLETAELAGVAAALAAIRRAVALEMGPDYGSVHTHPPLGGHTERN